MSGDRGDRRGALRRGVRASVRARRRRSAADPGRRGGRPARRGGLAPSSTISSTGRSAGSGTRRIRGPASCPTAEPTPSFSSVAAVGFGLSAYPIGAERGWVTREEARDRVLDDAPLPLERARRGRVHGRRRDARVLLPLPRHGDGNRWFEKVELSTIDTTLCLSGALFCAAYFDRRGPRRGRGARARGGALPARGLALGGDAAPAARLHGLDARGGVPHVRLERLQRGDDRLRPRARVADASGRGRRVAGLHARPTGGQTLEGQTFLNFAPLFGHQFSHVFLDLRGIRDAYMRGKGIDYFENSRRATLAQRAYAIANPGRLRGATARTSGASRPATAPPT